MLEKEEIEKLKRAGRIAAESLDFGRSLIKISADLFLVCQRIEAKAKELGGELAFPVNISINDIAAHYTPMQEGELFKDGDVVKLDLGVHVEGYIADTACTVDLGGNKELVRASEKALANAIRAIKPGVMLCEIGGIIEEAILDLGFKPIRNLSGHAIERYSLHTGLTVPNFDNKDKNILEDGMVVAIEPFATNGAGLIKDFKPSGIFRQEQERNTRDIFARKVLDEIKKFHGLPFAKHWINKFSFNIDRVLAILEREGILYQYNLLKEINNGLVSQAEHTVLVGEKSLVITKSI